MPQLNMNASYNGSNYSFGDKMEVPINVPRSLFDLSHSNITTIKNCGEIIPIALIETIPNDTIEISVRSLLRVLPQVVPLYSSSRIKVYAHYGRMGDYYTDFNTFMTKGYSGNELLTLPKLTDDNLDPNIEKVEPDSLLNYLGLPIGMTRQEIIDSNINAIPFMMYKRIKRDYMTNKNYYINNRNLLPDNDDTFRLNRDSFIQSNIDANNQDDYVYLGNLEYAEYPQDYFTSALPFPQRGNMPTLNLSLADGSITGTAQFANNIVKNVLSTGSVNITSENLNNSTQEWGSITNPTQPIRSLYTDISSQNNGQGNHSVFVKLNELGQNVSSDVFINNINTTVSSTGQLTLTPSDFSNNPLTFTPTNQSMSTNISLNDIRKLAVEQSELEKMARTDGSYEQFGLTFFGRSSKNAIDFKPVLMGQSYEPIVFSEVLQTSAPTDGQTPLGTYGGHGISYSENGYLGKIDTDDYGYIMVTAVVMPDIYYSQGLDKNLTKSLQSDMYLQSRAKLGLIPILNKELYFSGNNETDNDLFAYQNPFDEYRYIPNKITGKIADPSNLSFYPYTQARHFTTTPTFSESFALANNVRKDYLASSVEDSFTAKFDFDIRAVRPLTYKATPENII